MGTSMKALIAKKRDGLQLSGEEIRTFVNGYTAGDIPDFQASALLMAIFCRGLDDEETMFLTEAMVASGERVDLSSVPGIKADKHSTGGVGDKTTLVLVPLVAAAGLMMAKLSGRSLGHTGGTLDKLAAIPGFNAELGPEAFFAQVTRVGAAIAGQSVRLVPADKKLYRLRDLTATVESVPLIASSVMSKKIAAGADVIVLDVKAGRGAFMRTAGEARLLARAMVDIGTRLGRRVGALVTAMEQPLGRRVGNALEVAEAIATLRGEGPPDLVELCLALGAEILVLAGAAETLDIARSRLARTLDEGRALALFRELVSAQGGDARVVDDPGLLPRAPRTACLTASSGGFVAALDALLVAEAAMEAGARLEDGGVLDPGAGVILRRKVGDPVGAGEILAEVHLARGVEQHRSLALLSRAFTIGAVKPVPLPLVLDRITDPAVWAPGNGITTPAGFSSVPGDTDRPDLTRADSL
ncbi:MAG: thymidine phosphorylase [Peptococcaceae bacterium]|jgi:pyrimidine-nucleoside phosphorylase|nr:thymidine phosphorylase [Peptococcaceae bacterium]